ncbi:hypothetical protein MCEMOHM34_00488 [Candidatus Methylopumilus universalis]|uniref:hypothetical protein n=1 Tax=Candidatus Methylopumilus universalis TaxID=2588536 RepID=UPI003BEF20A3
MKIQEFESTLFKESIKALYDLCDGSEDNITLEERLEHYGRFRIIIGNTQIISHKFGKENSREITFVFSPDYMLNNYSIVVRYYLDSIKWKLILPNYDYGDESRTDEGVPLWLSRGIIEIIKNDFSLDRIHSINFDEFVETLAQNIF